MILHQEISKARLASMIRHHQIQFGGNRHLKIFGKLHCVSGKRMKRKNRVFFNTIREAIALGYRPCAHCMEYDYKKWKHGFMG
jgi:methylphosphotriester-DNA--protein-cysteine methyltransferase